MPRRPNGGRVRRKFRPEETICQKTLAAVSGQKDFPGGCFRRFAFSGSGEFSEAEFIFFSNPRFLRFAAPPPRLTRTDIARAAGILLPEIQRWHGEEGRRKADKGQGSLIGKGIGLSMPCRLGVLAKYALVFSLTQFFWLYYLEGVRDSRIEEKNPSRRIG